MAFKRRKTEAKASNRIPVPALRAPRNSTNIVKSPGVAAVRSPRRAKAR